MAIKVERWEDIEGHLYESEELADYASNSIKLRKYIDDNPLCTKINGKTVTLKGQEVLLWAKMSAPRLFITLLPEDSHDETNL